MFFILNLQKSSKFTKEGLINIHFNFNLCYVFYFDKKKIYLRISTFLIVKHNNSEKQIDHTKIEKQIEKKYF